MNLKAHIVERASFKVAGDVTSIRRGTERPALFGRVWNDFETRRRDIEPHTTRKRHYGVSFPTDDEVVTDYLAGMAVPNDTPSPEGCEVRTVPGGTFAVFECAIEGIGAIYQDIFTVWHLSSSFELENASAAFEEYSRSTLEQQVRIHIPVRQPRV